MTNEDFIARTSIELGVIRKKIHEHIGQCVTSDLQQPDSCRLQIACHIVDAAIAILENPDPESIAYVADLLDSVAEDCTYLAEELDKQ